MTIHRTSYVQPWSQRDHLSLHLRGNLCMVVTIVVVLALVVALNWLWPQDYAGRSPVGRVVDYYASPFN